MPETETSDAKRLYKIGEVCRMADVQPYVLRYWETEFPQLAPNKSGGGQRMYTRREIDIVLRIKQLLYSEGFTIAGAKKRLEVELDAGAGESALQTQPRPEIQQDQDTPSGDELKRALVSVKQELTAILRMLDDA